MSFSRATVVACLALVASVSSAKAPLATDARLEQAASASLTAALSELRSVLSDGSLGANRMNAVRRVLRSRVDYSKFARFALARDTGGFSSEQLDRYECEFNEYLSHLLGTRLAQYKQEQFKVTRATALPNRDVVLSARISGGNHDGKTATFLMRAYSQSLDDWRAIDIAFDGTRVRQLLRDRFEPALRKGGPERLITMIQQQTPRQPSCTSSSSSDSGSNAANGAPVE